MHADDKDAAFAHLIRATIAIVLTLALPVLLYVDVAADADVQRVYLDALTAVVAFYFGASSRPN
jgi:hypothetical protein